MLLTIKAFSSKMGAGPREPNLSKRMVSLLPSMTVTLPDLM